MGLVGIQPYYQEGESRPHVSRERERVKLTRNDEIECRL
jgi:hypothetical protein